MVLFFLLLHGVPITMSCYNSLQNERSFVVKAETQRVFE